MGQAFSFNGDGAVALPTQPPLAQGFTVTGWVNFDSSNFDSFQTVFNNNQFFLRKNGVEEGNGFAAFVNLADGSVEPRAQSDTVPTAGTWTYLAASWDGAMLRMYVNGELESNRIRSGSLTSTVVQAQIGRGEQTVVAANPVSGLVDEFDIYDSTLSDVEIRAIYLAGSLGKCQP